MAEQERYGPDVDPGESVASLFEKLIAMPWADDFEFRIEGPLSHPSRSHEVFPYALRLLESENAVERYRAMDILGRLGNPRRAGPFTETVLRLAIQALQDPHPHVVRSAATVIRDWGTPQTEAILVTLASYPDPDVRICAAIGLAYKLEHLEILTALSRDPDDDIRDWATFGIAGIGVDGPVDTPEIRAALRDRLEDPFEIAAREAMRGLALRRDPEALRRLREALATDPWRGDIDTAREILGLSDEDEHRLIAGLDELLAAANGTSAP